MTATEPTTRLHYRPATEGDQLLVTAYFSRMLRELEPLGHDILPTEDNVAYFWGEVFEPALKSGEHGIYIAFAQDDPIGCTFFLPEQTVLDTPRKRAIAYGIWVEPDWRRLGVALRLQMHAHGRLCELGYEELVSNVVANNAAGLGSAQAAGAQVVGFMTSVRLKGAE